MAFGTLSNGGGLGSLTSIFPITVDAGATLNVNDQSVTVTHLLGAGMVKLGSSAATTLTVNGGSFGGVISGAGHVTISPNGLALTGTGDHLYRWDDDPLAGGGLSIEQWRDHRRSSPATWWSKARACSSSTVATPSLSPAISPAADLSPNMARAH